MADGEKKRFGNFAEYAKARQGLPEDRQGLDIYHFAQDQQMPGMAGPGNSDQSRFMQSFSSSQTGQQMGMMGGSLSGSGLPMQQGLQQRGMGAPGSSGLGGMANMQMNRAPLGMSLGLQGGGNSGGMSGLGLAGRSQQAQSSQGAVQGIMGQRMNQMQGGGAGGPLNIGRPSTIGMQSGQPGYNPSGEILAMLNKGGMGSSSMNGGAQGQAGLPPNLRGSDVQLVGVVPQTEFSMEEDFPALPGASSGQGPNNSLMSGGTGSHGIVEHFQRMKIEGNMDDLQGHPSTGQGAVHEKPDRFGMLGLLSVIRMVDENLNTLALGTDLTHLGLNLNASDNLYETFTTPWADTRASRTPEYTLPRCYYISPPALKTMFFNKFSDMTLFYIFYHFLTRPSDAPHQDLRNSLVKYAYSELVQRGWQFQQEGNLWVTRVQGTSDLKYFDMHLMELRPFLPGQGSGQSSSGTSTPSTASQVTESH